MGLVLANLIPLVGVIWFGWDLFGIVWIYWAENGIIGAYALLRILTAGENHWLDWSSKVFFGPFFVFHFGIFWFVHGGFVYALFGSGQPFVTDGASLSQLAVAAPLAGLVPLVLSHGASFVFNYLLGGERQASTAGAEMIKPYGRVVVLHIVILGGALLIQLLGAPILALVLFIVLKTALDLTIHLTAHAMRAKANADSPGRERLAQV